MRKVFYNSIVARLFLWRKNYRTAMFFGFICTKYKVTEPLTIEDVNHEAIHAEQYAEITVAAVLIALIFSIAFGWAAWPFLSAIMLYYVIYFVEAGISWCYNFFVHQKTVPSAAADRAYYNSMFEMEAHDNEDNIGHIPSRKPFHWLRYLGKI